MSRRMSNNQSGTCDARLVVALSLLTAGLLLGVVLRGARSARFPLALFALGIGGGVRGDLLHEPIREPLSIGDVKVFAASVGGWQFEQAAECTRRVGVLVCEGEALAFALAAFFSQPEAARLLLERGSDPRAVSETFGNVTPLHSAAAAGNGDTVRALLAAGADPNARQQGAFTAIHAAAQNGDAQMLEDLLAAGADPSLATDEGKQAIDFATEAGHDAIAARLRDAR